MRQKALNLLKRKQFYLYLLLVLYSIFTFLFVLKHEPWRDETQAWLISRDLSIPGIISQMRFEGHPALWYLMLVPFARLGMSFLSVQILSWLIGIGTLFVFFKYSTFNYILKFCITISAGSLYFFTIIPRNYVLIPLILFIIAVLYKHKDKRPIIFAAFVALLANTHILMLGATLAIIAIYFTYDVVFQWNKVDIKVRTKRSIATIVMGLGPLLTYLQLRNSVSTSGNSAVVTNLFKPGNFQDLIIHLFVELNQMFNSLFYNEIANNYLLSTANNFLINHFYITFGALIIFLILLTMLVTLMRISFKSAFIFILGIGFQLYVYVFIYGSITEQRAALVPIFYLFCLWIAQHELESSDNVTGKKSATFKFSVILISFVFVFTFKLGVESIILDWNYAFSGGQATAQYISKEVPANDVIITSTDFTSASVLAYLPNRKFWYPQSSSYITYTTWNSEAEEIYPLKNIVSLINSKFSDKTVYLLLSNHQFLDYSTNLHFELVYASPEAICSDEEYLLYKFTK